MIRLLRLVAPSRLVSARTFEEAFATSLRPAVDVVVSDLGPWLDAALGPAPWRVDHLDDGAFRAATAGADFLCPDHVATAFAPLLVAQRNRSRSPARLLLIAHAPAAYALEWALLRPLLRGGDVIVAPTRSARDAIDHLCPEITPFVRVAPHPIPALPGGAARRRERGVVSLTRLHPTKLLHRQVEAAAELRRRGVHDVTMRIAGPLTDADTGEPSPYARSLSAKIRRLDLEGRVELAGPIDDRAAKARFLGEAALVLNLSVSLEESFGKTAVEALGCGVPVLGTRWDGLPETIGAGGATLPVTSSMFGMDVPAEAIADAIQSLLDAPVAAGTCLTEAERSDPARVRARYAELLDEATSAPVTGDPWPPRGSSAAPSGGLLGATAPLTELSWDEMFTLHTRDVAAQRAALAASRPPEPEELRTLVLAGVRSPMERLLAGFAEPLPAPPAGRRAGGDLVDVVARASVDDTATIPSRVACLHALSIAGSAELDAGLRRLPTTTANHWVVHLLRTEALVQRRELARAFALCIAPEDPAWWGEAAALRVRQLARLCREWGLPGLALPWLREWVARYPDSPDSGGVWLDRCSNAAGVGRLVEAGHALRAARELLGPSGALTELEERIAELGSRELCGTG